MTYFVTKTGAKVHRQTCRFAAGATEVKTTGNRGFCAVCKPHIAASALPTKSIGKENLAPCKVCKPGTGVLGREDATKAGHSHTPKGGCYHKATCGTLKPKARKAVVAAKPIKPIKGRERKDRKAVDASVMAAIGI